MMKSLDHPNVLKLRYAFETKKPDEEFPNFHLVMDYFPSTFGRWIRS